MAVIRKVQSRLNISPKPPVEEKPTPSRRTSSNQDDDMRAVRTKKRCFYCTNKNIPRYWETTTLRKFLNDRGRIVNKQRSGVCSKHQRRVAKEIKRARHLSLLPFQVRI